MIQTPEQWLASQNTETITETSKKTTNKIQSPSEWLKTQPEAKPTFGQKASKAVGGFVKGLVSPVATMVARPIQLGATLAGVPTEKIDKFTLGGLVAPTPKTREDVVKDVGRGVQTVAYGLPFSKMAKGIGGATLGTTAKLTPSAIKTAKTLGQVGAGGVGGGAFGFGVGLEQTGKPLGKETLKQTAIGTGLGAVAPLAVKGLAKVFKGKTKPLTIAPEAEKIPTIKVGSKSVKVSDEVYQKFSLEEAQYKSVIKDLKTQLSKAENKQKRDYYIKMIKSEQSAFEKLKRQLTGEYSASELKTLVAKNRKEFAKTGIQDLRTDDEIIDTITQKTHKIEPIKPTEKLSIKSGELKQPKVKLTEKQYKKYDDMFKNEDPTYQKSTIDTWVNKAKEISQKNSIDDMIDMIYNPLKTPEGLPKEALRKFLMENPYKLTTRQKIRLSNKLATSEAGAELRASQINKKEVIKNPFDAIEKANKKLKEAVKKQGFTKKSIIKFLDDNVCPI